MCTTSTKHKRKCTVPGIGISIEDQLKDEEGEQDVHRAAYNPDVERHLLQYIITVHNNSIEYIITSPMLSATCIYDVHV